jgi:hypothetical protein
MNRYSKIVYFILITIDIDINVIIDKTPFNLYLTYTPSMQINLNTENSTLIGENPAIYKEIEVRIKYAEKYADF